MTKIYNGEERKITVVSDGNPDAVIEPGETVEITLSSDAVISDSFYVLEDGEWYTKETDGRVEIYNAGK
ncbi:hypothetical protein [Paenibacillus apiarius]|uniref:hypothetical protein n=1 Tax=Paenibacillus apiarius TaxID=46240 RepID=UPI003B3A84AC